MSYPRPVDNPEALEAAQGLMSVVGTIAIAQDIGQIAGLENVMGGMDVSINDLGIAAGGGIEKAPGQLEL